MEVRWHPESSIQHILAGPSCIPKQNISTSHLNKRRVQTGSCCVHRSHHQSHSLELTRVVCLRDEWLRIQLPYCDLGSILFGIVEVLAVVPVSSSEVPVPYVDGC